MALDKRNILSKQEKIRQFGEVFTPQKTVEQMCDLLEEQDADAFAPEKTFLEPCCGEGVFVLEILRRKFERCKCRKDYTTAIKSVYAMELQADNVEKTIAAVMELCETTFRPTKEEREIIKDHVIQADSLKIMRMINDMNERESQ